MSNIDIEQNLYTLPDTVAQALENWRLAELDREKVEALLYARFKAEDNGRTASDVKALLNANLERYEAVLKEIKAESNYHRLSERLMSFKKIASLRTAF